MPVVGGTASQRVQIQNQLLAVDDRQRRMPLGQRAQPTGKVDLLACAEVLAPDEHHPVVVGVLVSIAMSYLPARCASPGHPARGGPLVRRLPIKTICFRAYGLQRALAMLRMSR